MHHILEVDCLISSGWLDLSCSGPDLINLCVSSEANNALSRSPVEEVRSVRGNMVCCARIHHPARSTSSVEGNWEIIIVIDLFYSSGSDMCIDRFITLRVGPLLLFVLLILLVLFLLAALITLVPQLLAVKVFDLVFICLIALPSDRSDLV